MCEQFVPKTVTQQRRDCDLNPGPSAPESSTLTTRLPARLRVTRQTHRGDAADSRRVEVLLSSSARHVLLEVGDVAHEAETVLRRVRHAQQTLLDLHLGHYTQQCLCIVCVCCLQCVDTVGWAAGRSSGL